MGYITRGKGVSVHAATCPNVLNLLYDPERRIDVVWDRVKSKDSSAFTVCLTIQVEDRRGILADVTSRIADSNINMRKVEATSSEHQHGLINVTLRHQRPQAFATRDQTRDWRARRAGCGAGAASGELVARGERRAIFITDC